jgi:hypothetical protein
MTMKGYVLTDAGQPIQVVSVTDESGQQIATATYVRSVSDSVALISWVDTLTAIPLARRDEVREAARAALRERDSHFMRIVMGGVCQALNARVPASDIDTPVLAPSGSKMSVHFQRNSLETGPEEYRITIRRLPSQG